MKSISPKPDLANESVQGVACLRRNLARRIGVVGGKSIPRSPDLFPGPGAANEAAVGGGRSMLLSVPGDGSLRSPIPPNLSPPAGTRPHSSRSEGPSPWEGKKNGFDIRPGS